MSTTTSTPLPRRFGQACTSCHQKKAKCRVLSRNGPCEACASLNIECIPRFRKTRQVPSARSATTSLLSDEPHQAVGQSNWDGSPNANERVNPQNPLSAWQHTRGSSNHSTILSENLIQSRVPDFSTPVSLPHSNHPYSMSEPHDQGTSSRSIISNINPMKRNAGERHSDEQSTTYIGRSYYIGEGAALNEELARSYTPSKVDGVSEIEMKTLQLWGSFDIPPKPARQSLIECFMEYCYPWMPTLSQSEIQHADEKLESLLLMQSMFLAASRVNLSPGIAEYATSEQFYRRAKALFWAGHERNPLTVIKSITMLHWFNPDGPAYVSYDASEFWLKIGVGLAFQIGLHKEPSPQNPGKAIRRRIWWSLVVRDSLISVSHGRPRAVNLQECETSAPCLEDFPESKELGQLFIPYVEICCLLGDLAACASRRKINTSKRTSAENALFRWTRSLPVHLRLAPKQLNIHNYDAIRFEFRARQLHIPYLICLAILARSTAVPGELAPMAVLAASYVAGISECFLTRDQNKLLSPVFTNFCLVSGIVLLSVSPYPDLWDAVQPDLKVLQNCLAELSQKWRSAVGASKALQRAIDLQLAKTANGAVPPPLPAMPPNQLALFEGLSIELCRLWPVFHMHIASDSGNINVMSLDTQAAQSEAYPHVLDHPTHFGLNPGEGNVNYLDYGYGGIGNWFMDDWDHTALSE